MKVLLVSPQSPDTFWSFKYVLPFVAKRAVFPPLGLLTVAAMLPRSWDVKLVDLNVSRLRDADLRWADYVMISAMIVHKESVHEIIARCRAGRPSGDRRRAAVHHGPRGVRAPTSTASSARRKT